MRRSEHIARAMLIGMKYSPSIGLYFKGNLFDGEQIDAMTLEPLSWDEVVLRIDGSRPEDFVWYKEDPEDDASRT
ncbi:hypothetical protein EVB31_040 [Rhizobium phage RHph_TM29]|nr:hypothetical protein EVB29_041 [Rhizobium phage RHph_TM27A]QIG66961.1 hypothetical protein EVB30_041 [Rhizobium phage RHph_TM27B]QIG67050.1 hypothetical protein EVB31_040 [Rhizobium phage RHph_TM29]